jgi:hypothetical protein
MGVVLEVRDPEAKIRKHKALASVRNAPQEHGRTTPENIFAGILNAA